MFCPKCGTKNIDGAKFCGACGAPLVSAADLPSQGAPVNAAPVPQSFASDSAEARGGKKSKPVVIGAAALVAVAVVVAVVFGANLFIPSGDPVSTMYLACGEHKAADFGFSIDGDDASIILQGQSVTGKVRETRQSGDATVYEVGQVSLSGQEMPGDSKILLCAPKEATTVSPAGQWGVTVLGDFDSGRQVARMMITVGKGGSCSYSVGGVGGNSSLSSDDFDAIAADPLMDLSSFSGNRDYVTASGTLNRADSKGRFAVDMGIQSDDMGITSDSDAARLTGTLNLSGQYFDDLSKRYSD